MQVKFTKKDGKYFKHCRFNDGEWGEPEQINYDEETEIYSLSVGFVDGTPHWVPVFVSKELFKEEK
jgi:hypothetical protein